MNRWGTDHWELLFYVESVVVGDKGRVGWQHLMLSKRNWPTLHAVRSSCVESFGDTDAADEFGLHLRSGADNEPVVLYGHCEADALMDLVDAGLVTITMPGLSEDGKYFLKPDGHTLDGEDDPRPGFMTGLTEWQLMPWARFGLTGQGRTIANELRAHRSADGATWSNFEPSAKKGWLAKW